jgi:hypothetical protein
MASLLKVPNLSFAYSFALARVSPEYYAVKDESRSSYLTFSASLLEVTSLPRITHQTILIRNKQKDCYRSLIMTPSLSMPGFILLLNITEYK